MTIIEHPVPTAISSEHLSGATLYADRNDALDAWPRGAVIAELGVGFGAYSQLIMDRTHPKLFDAYDLFNLHEQETLWGRPSSHFFKGMTQIDFYRNRFKTHFDTGRMRAFEGDSSSQLKRQPNQSYDVIYIDGDHTLNGVKRDSGVALSSIKPDGILVFNDYVYFDRTGRPYGVINVVNDLCVNHGWKVKYIALQPQMFCDIAIFRPH
jgi:hypothetical protein